MEFTLLASATPNNDLLKNYPCLCKFGYFIDEKSVPQKAVIKDENGELIWQHIGDIIVKTPKIVINDLNDLVSLIRMTERPVILSIDEIEDPNCADFSIELYDGYRE